MKLVFLYGPPAAGKLTVATELSKQIGYKLIDNHKAIDYITELFPRSNDPVREKVRSRLGRQIRLDIFAAAAQSDVNLLTTFAPLSPGTLDFMREVRQIVEENGGQTLFVQLLPSRETLLHRVTGDSRLGKKIDNHGRWQEAVGNNPSAFETFPDVEHCVIDNSSLSPAETAQKIIECYQL